MTQHATAALLAIALTGGLAAPADAAIHRDLAGLDLGHADQGLNRGGPGFQVLYSPAAGTLTYMAGARGVGYLAEHVYLGGAGYGGSSGSGGMGYGGLIAGWDGAVGEGQRLDVGLLFGGGGGNGAGGGLALAPEVAYGRLFGGGWRGAIALGYLYVPAAAGASGITAGLRLEFKALTLTLPVDD